MRNIEDNVFVAGHKGMVGSAIVRQLKALGYKNIITKTRDELDLRDQNAVELFFANHSISQVYCAAAKVGGIHANNTYPAEFIYENLQIELNLIHFSWKYKVPKLMFLGSSCIYPKNTEQPIAEHQLLTGKLEPTNEPYAIAKIAGIKLCESYNRQHGLSYQTVMPTNLYGPGDNYHPENSHVLPALIRRFHEAKLNGLAEVIIWGSGKPFREFLYVDDMADACVYLMELSNDSFDGKISPMASHINIGTGIDCTIAQLAELIAKIVGYDGRIIFDSTKPDGTYRKVLSTKLVNELGWFPKYTLEHGLDLTYQDFLVNQETYL